MLQVPSKNPIGERKNAVTRCMFNKKYIAPPSGKKYFLIHKLTFRVVTSFIVKEKKTSN